MCDYTLLFKPFADKIFMFIECLASLVSGTGPKHL